MAEFEQFLLRRQSDQYDVKVALPDLSVTGSLTALGSLGLSTDGMATVLVSLTGTWLAAVVFEGQTADGSWIALPGYGVGTGLPAGGATGAGAWRVHVAGFAAFQVRCSAYTSGTIGIALEAGAGAPGTVGVWLLSEIAGEDLDVKVMKTEQRFLSWSTNAAGSAGVKIGPGLLHTLNVLGGTLGAVTLYDNTVASGTLLVPPFTPAGAASWLLDASFGTGLTVVTAAATVLQLSYR